ncbi:unnamed protein product [Schistosoma mattheei]|uniref:Uncharacterized protein n=1 Tax=Schistosoma mattheei TaxID=31246 RepID=A0A183P845_9TREM|nr:unnamed protein product [Schistosoma mattheei]
MNAMTSDLKDKVAYFDDIKAAGSTEEDLMSQLDLLPAKIYQTGFQLQKKKHKPLLGSVKYLGYIFDEDGHPLGLGSEHSTKKYPQTDRHCNIPFISENN